MKIVLVHGYLATRTAMRPLAYKLKRLGHTIDLFGYPSHRGDIDRHANTLNTHLQTLSGPLAVVGHSMGGLIVHAALCLPNAPIIDRLVLMATPHGGSHAARRQIRGPLARFMSPGVRRTAHPTQQHATAHRTGIIVAGKDRIIGHKEADWADADDRLTLPYGHNEILFRPQTAAAIGRFIELGHFEATLDMRWDWI